MGTTFLTLNQTGSDTQILRTFTNSVSRSCIASSGTAALTIPDLSQAPGWQAAWAIPLGRPVHWFGGVSATSTPGAAVGNFCVEGAWSRQASGQGTL